LTQQRRPLCKQIISELRGIVFYIRSHSIFAIQSQSITTLLLKRHKSQKDAQKYIYKAQKYTQV